MELKDMTLEQCKVTAYDELRKMEITQNNLRLLNQRIAELEKPKEPEIVKE